jgi:membrane protein
MFGFTQIWSLLKDAASDWVEDKAPQLGAALAFYSVLSVTPLLIIAISIASLVYGEEAARGQILVQAENMVGTEGALAIREMLEHAQKPGSGMFATVFGVATLLLGASGVFGQLQDAMNTIWEVPAKEGNSIWNFVHARFLSFAMVLGTGFLLLVSLILSALISGSGEYLSGQIQGLEPIMHLATGLVTFLLVSILFAMIFKLLPDTRVEWEDVWIGAVLTAALFTIGKLAIGVYLGKSGLSSAYGAAGSLVVLVLWIYYSAQILFFGAELTQAYARRFGSRAIGEQQQSDQPAVSGKPHSSPVLSSPGQKSAASR